MIKNVIFDMGNVLFTYDVDEILNHFSTDEEEKAAIKKGLFQSREWAELDRGNIENDALFEAVKKRIDPKYHNTLWQVIEHWYDFFFPIDGRREKVKEIKEMGYSVYVLSNAGKDFYRYFGQLLPIDWFDGSVISCDVHITKPDRGIYEILLNKYNLIPEECIFFDDMEENVEAARQLGINGVVFRDVSDFDILKKVQE